jgi:hypothetical protein
VKITAQGYKTIDQKIKIIAGETTVLTFNLVPKNKEDKTAK